MARRNDIRQVGQPNALVASAQNVTGFNEMRALRSQNSSWQESLWTFYDTVGEFEFVAQWVSSMLSRAKMKVHRNGSEITSGPAYEAMSELFGSEMGRSEALGKLGLQMTVAGEAYIVCTGPDSAREWNVYAPQVVSRSGGEWKIDGNSPDGSVNIVIRTWIPHPRRPREATSSSRSALPILNEIYRATQHVEAQLLSRLTSAGLLLLPNEMTFASASDSGDGESSNQSNADAFVREFIDVASAAMNNRNDASATIPIVMTADGEHLDKPRLLEFWSSLDEHVLETRDKAIARLALALDVPPEILTGTGDVSHWQAWGVDESAIKSHAEPLLSVICNDLTRSYLWPALKDVVPDHELHEYTLAADTTGLRVRPNRSQEAITLFEHGELSPKTMRLENGFSEDDAPSDQEREDFMYRKVAAMAADTSMSAQALQHLGLEIAAPEEPAEGNQEQEPPGVGDVPDRSAVPSDKQIDDLIKDAERKAEASALIAACEQMVFRALERAGNRAKSKLHYKPTEGQEPAEFYLFRSNTDAEASYMLDGAFSHCDRFATQYGMSSSVMRLSLESYCRDLIVGGKPYTRRGLEDALRVKESANNG